MKEIIAGLVLFALAAVPSPASGQDVPLPRQVIIGQAARAAIPSAERQITLELRDGTTFTGALLEANEESVLVQRANLPRRFPLRDIQKAVITWERKRSMGIPAGAAAGLALGYGLALGAFAQPGFYLREISSEEYPVLVALYLFFIEAPAAALGGGIGSALASGTSRRTFEFPGDPVTIAAMTERFLRFVNEGPPPARFHLNIQGGVVDPRVSRALDATLGAAGSSHWTDRSRFSVLRAFELSYSLKSWLKTGVRVSFPGEPPRQAYLTGDAPFTWFHLSQAYESTAVHAVCAAELFRRKPSNLLSWTIGLGGGAAAVALRREMYYYQDYAKITSDVESKKTLPSAVVFSALQLRVNPIFSIGVAADCTFIPAATLPAMPEIGLPSREIGLTNASIGFVLGYHF